MGSNLIFKIPLSLWNTIFNLIEDHHQKQTTILSLRITCKYFKSLNFLEIPIPLNQLQDFLLSYENLNWDLPLKLLIKDTVWNANGKELRFLPKLIQSIGFIPQNDSSKQFLLESGIYFKYLPHSIQELDLSKFEASKFTQEFMNSIPTSISNFTVPWDLKKELVSTLLESNKTLQFYNLLAKFSCNVFYWSCFKGYIDIVKFLVENLKQSNLINEKSQHNGRTPLFISCQNGHFE